MSSMPGRGAGQLWGSRAGPVLPLLPVPTAGGCPAHPCLPNLQPSFPWRNFPVSCHFMVGFRPTGAVGHPSRRSLVECPHWTLQWGSWDVGSVFWIMPCPVSEVLPEGGPKPPARESAQGQLLRVPCSRATEQTSSREPGHCWSCNLRCCHLMTAPGLVGKALHP